MTAVIEVLYCAICVNLRLTISPHLIYYPALACSYECFLSCIHNFQDNVAPVSYYGYLRDFLSIWERWDVLCIHTHNNEQDNNITYGCTEIKMKYIEYRCKQVLYILPLYVNLRHFSIKRIGKDPSLNLK